MLPRIGKSAKQLWLRFPVGWLVLSAGLYSSWLLKFGAFPGQNYDSYQYVYAVLARGRLGAQALAEFGRLHVHSAYHPLWSLFALAKLPVWQAASWLGIGCTAATVGAIYLLAKAYGCQAGYALAAALIWQSLATVAFYANIPEIYAPWMLCLVLFLLSLERRQTVKAVAWFALATWLFLPSLLLLPAFSRLWLPPRRQRRQFGLGLTAAALATALGLGLHLGTLKVYGIPWLARLASEKVYWQVASGPLWYLLSTWESLLQSGMGLALIGCLAPLFLLARRLAPTVRWLLFLAVPLCLAPAAWVKDHGSFFLPFGLMLSLLLPLLWQQLAGSSRRRQAASLAVIALIVGLNAKSSWQQIAADRSMGQAQVDFCRQALSLLPADSQVLSSALLSTWLFVTEEAQRSDVHCRYFPWLVNASYAPVISDSLAELRALPGVYFVDPTVTSAVREAGRLLEALPVSIAGGQAGQLFWELQAVYLGGP